jgi:hypothetical protein
LKKGLFSVERVPKGIFWGETYFSDFYSIAILEKYLQVRRCFSICGYEIFMYWNMLMYQKNFQARLSTPSGFSEGLVGQIATLQKISEKMDDAENPLGVLSRA